MLGTEQPPKEELGPTHGVGNPEGQTGHKFLATKAHCWDRKGGAPAGMSQRLGVSQHGTAQESRLQGGWRTPLGEAWGQAGPSAQTPGQPW